jgi:hypothetical protein
VGVWTTEVRTSISKTKLEKLYKKELEENSDNIDKAVEQVMNAYSKPGISPAVKKKIERKRRAMEEKKYMDKLQEEAEKEARAQKKTRKVPLEVKHKVVKLSPKKGQAAVEVTVVQFKEKEEHKFFEDASFTVLTTREVNTTEEAVEQGRRYEQRWSVEEYFNTFKSGMQSEEKAYETIEDFRRFAAIIGPLSAELNRWKDKLRTAREDRIDKYLSKEMIEKVNLACEKNKLEKVEGRSKMRALELALGYLGGYRKGSKYEIGKKILLRGLQEVEKVWEDYHIYKEMFEKETKK